MPNVIDADTHIFEPKEMWEHLDKGMYLRRPIVVEGPRDTIYRRSNFWIIDGTASCNRCRLHCCMTSSRFACVLPGRTVSTILRWSSFTEGFSSFSTIDSRWRRPHR